MSERTAECVGGPLDGERRTAYRPGKGVCSEISKGVWEPWHYKLEGHWFVWQMRESEDELQAFRKYIADLRTPDADHG